LTRHETKTIETKDSQILLNFNRLTLDVYVCVFIS